MSESEPEPRGPAVCLLQHNFCVAITLLFFFLKIPISFVPHKSCRIFLKALQRCCHPCCTKWGRSLCQGYREQFAAEKERVDGRMLTGVLSLLACSPGAFLSCVIQMTAFSHLVAFQATDGVEILPPVYLFSQPLLTSSHTPRHLHTKPQSDFKKKKSKTFPQPHSKCQVFQFWEKRKLKKGWLMTGLTNNYLKVCWWVTAWRFAFMLWKGPGIEEASWDQPVKFHYSLKPLWR